MFFQQSKTFLGLDIGSSYIKIVELKESGSRYTLQNFGIAILPTDTIVDGTIMDSMAIVNTIKNLIENLKSRKKQICTSISGHSVIIKKILLPVMDEATVENTIYEEAAHHIPYDIYDVNLDFQILGPSSEADDKMDVLLVAVKKDIISDYLGVIEEAGLVPVIVDVDNFALENMYEYNYEDAGEEVVALVDIGSNITNINIIKQGVSNFTRDITVGSRMITEQLQKQLNLNYQTAEQLKIGVPVEGINRSDLEKIIADAAFSFINEINKTIDFYHTSASGSRIEKIYLGGGGAKLAGIVSMVHEITTIETEIINSFRNLIVPEKKFDSNYIQDMAPLAAVAVGLALRKDTIK
ncbi:MAG: type IV pilus assembly protein PilM [Deltaproteobacteria bacterium]|nr:type IV pilus assembly protein PilM [Candidatus Anaeroferrophillus wilburensis]MBN2888097.1 type IV pilus assembly protein PilM [Deltaproteobacteria bacterium]